MSVPLRINGDAKDLNASGDLHICGSVSAGGKIKAQGSITIEGEVEPGATITANGDIKVLRGINGETTKVVTLGSLESHFIRNGAVVALGDVSVGYYLSNARVKAGGTLAVGNERDRRGGSVVGGSNFASQGVVATTIGSPGSNRTIVGLVPSPKVENQLSKLRRKLSFCQSEIQRIVRTLGLRQLNRVYLIRLIQRTPAKNKTFVRGLIDKLLKLVEAQKVLNDQRTALEDQADHGYEGRQLTVRDQLYAGVQIRIGSEILEIEENMGAVEARREDWGIDLVKTGE